MSFSRDNIIQIVYAPGTWGNTLRWLLDRFTKGSKFQSVDSPWDKDDRAHGFAVEDFNKKFIRGHQMEGRIDSPVPGADKVMINFKFKDLLFVERCGFYRNVGCENEEDRLKKIIEDANASFVKESFGSVRSSKSVAKELLKIQFHDMQNHKWWNSAQKFMADESTHQFDLYSLWDHDKLIQEFDKISDRYNLDFDIDEKVIHNVVEKVKSAYPVMTRNRANTVLDAIVSKTEMDCSDLDIVEQAFIETELEKIHDSLLFPYGSQWFKDTLQINEFLDTYPTYLKHMNPRLPWYNNIKNPFYLTGKI